MEHFLAKGIAFARASKVFKWIPEAVWMYIIVDACVPPLHKLHEILPLM